LHRYAPAEIIRSFTGVEGRINRVLWGPLNETLISGGEDGIIRVWWGCTR
jgi:translation initiation factor 3 subunit I